MSSTGARSGEWAVLRLDPWRVMILTAADAAAGRWYQRVWRP
jgi:hypothetical protein